MSSVDELYVYYSLVDPEMPDQKFFAYLEQIPAGLRPDVLRYHRRADQVRTLVGKLLMKEAIVQAGFSAELMDSILYTSFKRPYIADNFDFNITHSGYCVACAAGFDMKLGIDVEEIKPITADDITTVLRDEELHEMQQANATPETILHFWTRKEAIVKASGEGLYMQPQEIYFIDELTARTPGNIWHLHKLDIDDAHICYCVTNRPGRKIILTGIDY
jgi:4'-phosphopantetheinyl transferase